MVGPSVFPEKQVISEWLVLQYFQKSRLYQNAWSFGISRFTRRKSSFEVSKYTIFEICSEIRVSGPSHSIRLVKTVSKNSARAQINSKCRSKINILIKNRKHLLNSSLLSPWGRFYTERERELPGGRAENQSNIAEVRILRRLARLMRHRSV